jgi:hypothetical protein
LEITDDAVKQTELPYTRSVTMNTHQKKEKNEQRVPGSWNTTEKYRRLAKCDEEASNTSIVAADEQ